MFRIDIQSAVPIYKQVYDKVIELTLKQVLRANDKLPSVRALSKQLGVNPNTIQKAYLMLENEKIIYTLPGRGSFISELQEDILKKTVIEDFTAVCDKALNMGVDKNQLIKVVNNRNEVIK